MRTHQQAAVSFLARVGALAGAVLIAGGGLSASAARAEPAEPKTYTVKKENVHTEVKLSGVFEARRMAEIVLRPEAWSQLRVVKAAEHGAAVKKGDVLIQLDVKKIDQALREKEAAVALGELAARQAAEELRHLEKVTPEQLAQVERGWKRAREDFARFTKVDRPLAQRASANTVKYRTDVLAYTREELRQLLKMYKADDLTDETEEIVLKRQKDAVQRAEFALEQAKIAHERKTKIDLPRQAEDLTAAQRAADEGRKSKLTLLPMTLGKKRIEAAKAKRDHEQGAGDLAKLKKDRAAMTVRAPTAGIVYYGRCARGKWATAATVAPKLAAGGTLAADQVVMTVADPAELLVRATVPEKELHRLRKRQPGRAVPTGYPGRKLKVELDALATVPLPSGSFDAKLKLLDKPAGLTPGMTCSLTLDAEQRKGVLTVPAAAVQTDPKDPKARFVYLKTPGKPQKRLVKVGPTHAGKTEILEGLAEGEVIFLQPPKD